MNDHISSILELVKSSSPIPINDNDVHNIEENIKNELHEKLKKILTKWIEKDFHLNDINFNEDNYDDSIISLEMSKRRFNRKIKKYSDSIAKKIIYDYINIKCVNEYAKENREYVMTYMDHIDINYNYNSSKAGYHSMLHYATKKEDIEMIKIILKMKPNDIYQVHQTENFEIIGLFIDYICDYDLCLNYNERENILFCNTHKIQEFICKHPRAKEFLGEKYDYHAKKYFNNNFDINSN
ncbi:hypothetical protein QLL95_gp0148 [Cotonvirus japonicus]|uniref:Ankyrin repeat protein n=1 Tax=Cotonvirus japonicus TaxID=2811091 RepID=A0ABM7NRB9_9VIRU|nr:hypothetical protein QLL95_gp0148 [Cotonvirus japonicus]BCS82637.1 hypothetical protein [Cotonvirus japonicus]